MGRVLAIDYGKKRIGVAVSDPLGMFATGLETLLNEKNTIPLETIQNTIKEYQVETVVVGLPLHMSGDDSEMSLACRDFAKELESLTSVKIHLMDERFTSKIAEQSMQARGLKPSRNKGKIDQTAAMILLQNYLDGQR